MKLTVSNVATNQTVQLQSVGHVYGMPAGELKVGDTMVWNCGYTSTIKAVLKETKAFITYQTESEGKTYERRLKKTRLVAVPTGQLNYTPQLSPVMKWHKISTI